MWRLRYYWQGAGSAGRGRAEIFLDEVKNFFSISFRGGPWVVRMELDERYCDVIIKRWEEQTGEKAVLCREDCGGLRS